jgi:hypothetical protein
MQDAAAMQQAAAVQEAADMQDAAAARIMASSERLSRKAGDVAMHESKAAVHRRATGKPVMMNAADIAAISANARTPVEQAPAYTKGDIRAFFNPPTP